MWRANSKSGESLRGIVVWRGGDLCGKERESNGAGWMRFQTKALFINFLTHVQLSREGRKRVNELNSWLSDVERYPRISRIFSVKLRCLIYQCGIFFWIFVARFGSFKNCKTSDK